MSAEFDDLVARVRAVAMDEARAALTDATYPTAEQITAAHVDLVGRLWAAVVGGAVGGASGRPRSIIGIDWSQPTQSAEQIEAGLLDIRPGAFEPQVPGIRDYVETVGDHLRSRPGEGPWSKPVVVDVTPTQVPTTPRDPADVIAGTPPLDIEKLRDAGFVSIAIAAHNKPGRANE